VQRVEQAAVALAGVELGRDASTLVRWLAVKWVGVVAAGPAPVEVTTATVIQFCDSFFAVPGGDPYRWYDPFGSTWSKRAANGGWPVGTVWTQLVRPNAKLRAALSLQSSSTVTGERALLVTRLGTEHDYLDALQSIVPATKRIPALELAIWRYRFGAPDGIVDADGFVAALVGELHLSEQERAVVFADQPTSVNGQLQLAEHWPDEHLADVLPDPEPLQPVAAPPPEPPRDEPQSEEEDYRPLERFARLPLESADVDALVGRVQTVVQAAGLLLPDPDLIEQCVLTLLTGHLVLQGPPGTGKTTLARALAEAFDCSSELQTATADWSTYDMIGGLQPGVGEDGREVLRSWVGHVPRAALRCARTARAHEENPVAVHLQGHWLVIDEFSRAQVDKAIGGLYTMLGGSGEKSLELWFETDPGRKVVPIPRRFRILGTMNDVDASFVYDFSQGLSRRFQFVYVGVPRQEDLDPELDAALANAAVWLAAEYPEHAGTSDHVALVERWRVDARIQDVLRLLREVIARMRYPAAGAVGGGWPVGTAQIGDVLKRVVLREPGMTNLIPVLDAALADRIVPQMSGVKPIVLETLLDWLRADHAADLSRAIRAAAHLRDTSATT